MKHLKRDNPNYPPGHCMTITKCEKCGEGYEADKEHICMKKNSWPEFFPPEQCEKCVKLEICTNLSCLKRETCKYREESEQLDEDLLQEVRERSEF